MSLLFLAVMLALMLTFSVMATTPTTQPVQISGSQYNDAVLVAIGDQVFSSPPLVGSLSSGLTFISVQGIDDRILALHPAGLKQFETSQQVGADNKISQIGMVEKMMVNSLTPAGDEMVATTSMQSIAKDRLTNDAVGEMVAVLSITQTKKLDVGSHFFA
jgi:hypothetical protein